MIPNESKKLLILYSKHIQSNFTFLPDYSHKLQNSLSLNEISESKIKRNSCSSQPRAARTIAFHHGTIIKETYSLLILKIKPPLKKRKLNSDQWEKLFWVIILSKKLQSVTLSNFQTSVVNYHSLYKLTLRIKIQRFHLNYQWWLDMKPLNQSVV